MPAREPPAIAVEAPPGPRLDDWNLLRSFIAVHETGTLTEAARRLGTTQPSVGRHLRELETLLGETLFVRLPGRLQPTERAQALFDAALGMRHAVRDAERLFTGQPEQVAGAVRVAVSEAYGYHVVPPLLLPLLHEQPGLEIELAVSNRVDNLLRRDADIAVRFLRPQQDGVIARKLGETELGLYAHEDYLARFGEPAAVENVPAGVLAGFDRERWPLETLVRGPLPSAPLRFRFRSDSVLARQAAAECGGALAVYLADVAAERPGLRRVLREQLALRQEVWLCAHDELRRSSRMRFVWDRLGAALEERLRPPG